MLRYQFNMRERFLLLNFLLFLDIRGRDQDGNKIYLLCNALGHRALAFFEEITRDARRIDTATFYMSTLRTGAGEPDAAVFNAMVESYLYSVKQINVRIFPEGELPDFRILDAEDAKSEGVIFSRVESVRCGLIVPFGVERPLIESVARKIRAICNQEAEVLLYSHQGEDVPSAVPHSQGGTGNPTTSRSQGDKSLSARFGSRLPWTQKRR